MAPTKRKQWSSENMKRAIVAVRSKEMGLLRASKIYEVPKSTLKDKVNSGEADINKLISVKLGRKPILGGDIESALVKYCLEMECRFYGLTAKDIKRMAFQLAERNNLYHPFKKTDESAGWKWLRSFMKRHPQISLRKPQPTSLKRIKGFTKTNVKKFFDIYEPLLDLVKNNPCKVYNCDETGLTVVQHKTSKVISLKGKRQVGAVTSAERGSLVTVVTCMSAVGHYIPPLLVFPRKNMKTELLDGAPNGSTAACHKSGWIEMESFLKWFLEQFLPNAKPSKDDPVVLVLDGHYSHTRNLPLLDAARDNGVHIVSLPPHCSHKMQPLDRAFMSPFKTYYAQAIETWMKQNVGRVVTHYQIARLLGSAYNKSATVATAEHGFRVTGIFPLNRDVFQPHEFVAEDDEPEQLDHISGETQQQEQIQHPRTNNTQLQTNGQQSLSSNNQPPGTSSNQQHRSSNIELPGTSSDQQRHPSNIQPPGTSSDQQSRSAVCQTIQQSHASTSKQSYERELPLSCNTSLSLPQIPSVMPADISPLPSFQDKTKFKKARGRPSCPSAVLTSSPYKNKLSAEVVEKENKKKGGNKPKAKRPLISKDKKLKVKPAIKKRKRVMDFSSDSSEDELAEPLTVSTDEEDSDNDCECPFCNQSYSNDRSGEKWIICIKCRIWCHEQCSGTDNYKTYICDFCLDS